MILLALGVTATAQERVPLHLYVMSKCPDAVFCEARVQQVLRQVGSLVDLQVNYIAPNGKCLHGDSECDGNIQQLCIKELYPNKWFDFLQCQNKQFWMIPATQLVDQCGKPRSMITSDILKCMSDGTGASLFESSWKFTQAQSITTSCTIQLQGRTLCVRDGSQWHGCGGSVGFFVDEICKAFGKGKHGVRLPTACTKV